MASQTRNPELLGSLLDLQLEVAGSAWSAQPGAVDPPSCMTLRDIIHFKWDSHDFTLKKNCLLIFTPILSLLPIHFFFGGMIEAIDGRTNSVPCQPTLSR